MLRRLAAAVPLVALALAAPAQAASPPITLDPNPEAQSPNVAVEDNGTAHVVWEVDGATSKDGDTVRYCRLPRGATACDVRKDFLPDARVTFPTPDVLLPSPGKVQLLFDRCCQGPGDTQLVESTDGGKTFGTPRDISTIDTGESISGPGANAIGLFRGGSPTGIGVQVVPTDGGAVPSGYAELKGDCVSCYFTGGLGLIDSATPIVAYTDLTDTYVRVYDATKGTGYNSAANWRAPVRIPGESQPRLLSAGGVTYVMTHRDTAPKAYVVRRVAISDGSQPSQPAGTVRFTDPIPASDVDPIFGTMAGDPEGGLTTLWTTPGSGPIRSTVKPPQAGGFSRPGTLVDRVNAFNLEAATAPDRGGWVAWDANSGGPVQIAAIPSGGVVSDPPPPPPPGPAPIMPPAVITPADITNQAGCTRKLNIREGVTATVLTGCWTKKAADIWESKDDVDLNGIRFTTNGASAVTVNTTKHALQATQGVRQSAGPIVLANEPVTWDLDGETPFTKVDQAKIKLLDFDVVKRADVSFQKDAATIKVNLKMPDPFDEVTGATVLRTTTRGGLDLTGIHIVVPSATIGPFGVKNLDVTVSGGLSSFEGSGQLLLPPNGKALSLIKVAFENGRLTRLALQYDGTPLPIALTTGLWMNKVGIDYDGTNGFALAGGAEFGIPLGGDDGPFKIDALPGSGQGLRFAVPKGASYAELSLGGRFKFFGIDVGGVNASFRTSGELTFGAEVDIGVKPVVGLFGRIDGDFNLPQKTFYAYGKIQACVLLCAGFESTFSSIGVAACPEITFGIDPFSFKLTFLVGYKWKDGLDVGLGCNQGPYKPTKPGAVTPGAPAALVSPGVVDIGRNDDEDQPAKSIPLEVKGNGGVPGIKVTQGDRVLVQSGADVTRPVEGRNIVLVPNPGTSSARLLILQTNKADQIAGQLKIETTGTGAPLALRTTRRVRTAGGATAAQTVSGISTAQMFDDTKVTAKLGGKGRKRTVSFTATELGASGRSIDLVEEGPGGISKVIGSSKASSGTKRWTIFDGVAGKRRVVAVVRNFSGLPIASSTVATFTAPGRVLPGKPTRVKLRRSASSRLTITWGGTKGARQHLVVIEVADGRILRVLTARRRVTIPGVARREKVTVSVRGLTKMQLRGPAATARR